METFCPLKNVSVHKGSPETLWSQRKYLINSSSKTPVKSKYFLPLFINFVISTDLGSDINLFSLDQFYPLVAVGNNCCSCCSRIIILKDSLVL